MAQVIITCPFCHAQNMAMNILGVHRTNAPDSREYALERITGNGNMRKIYSHKAIGMAVCGKCRNPVGLSLSWQNEKAAREDSTDKDLLALGTADEMDITYALIPFPPQNAELKHLPPDVAKAFLQAEKNMQNEACEEAAVTMYRRTVERAIKSQYPTAQGSTLYQKIEYLEAIKLIPAAMKDWAHEIRVIGNDGAHDESVSRDDAEAAQAFTTAFLQYAVSLPQEVKERRAQTQPQTEQN